MFCETCGKEFFNDWRNPKTENRTGMKPKFCCRSCSNKRVHTNATKKKISDTIKKTFLKKEKTLLRKNKNLNKEYTHEELSKFKKEKRNRNLY
jgi:hypothetical protein